MPTARIIQCSDSDSTAVRGVDQVFRVEGDSTQLMTFRLKAFRDLGLESPALYMDTDMLLLRPIDLGVILEKKDAVVCERSFKRNEKFGQLKFKNFVFECYAGKTLMQAHPYIACFTITRNWKFWDTAYEILSGMPVMFHAWFGDQEAIKRVVESGSWIVKKVPESTYACLPEMFVSSTSKPRLMHFKGPERKALMLNYLRRLKNGDPFS